MQANDQEASKQQFLDSINQLLAFVFVLLFLSIIISRVRHPGTLWLSVFERVRELGLLRAVGMARVQVKRMVRIEAVIVAVLGAILGLVDRHRVRAGRCSGRCRTSASPSSRFPVGQLIVLMILAALIGRGRRRSCRRGAPPSSTCSKRSATSKRPGAANPSAILHRMPNLRLPDGTTVNLPEGEPVGSALPPGAIAARVDGVLRDLVVRPRGRRRGRAGRRADRRRAACPPALDRARPGPGGLPAVAGHQARHRPDDRRRLLLRPRDPGARLGRRPAADRGDDAGDRRRGPAVHPRGRLDRGGAPPPDRAAVQARDRRGPRHRRGRRRHRRRRPDRELLPQRRLGGPLPRSARALDRAARRLQAHGRQRRLLARRRAQPAAHPDLRHRLGDPGRPRRVPRAGSRRPRSGTTASSAPTSTCSRSPRRSVRASRCSIRAVA